MEKILALIVVLFLVLPAPATLFADLDEFQKDVEETEKESQIYETDSEEEEYADGEGSGSLVAQILFEVVRFMWLINNTTTTYGAYPYSPSG